MALCALATTLVSSGVSPLRAQTAPPTHADSLQAIYRRAQRLVTDGQGALGRAVVDSMLNAAEPGTRDEAEALYWRAMLAETWEGAQRDYLRIMLEHDRSARAGDAMLRLAQGEAARGDREGAVRYLERLVREAPDAPARAEADLWRGRLLLERGERDAGCTALRDGRTRLPAGALELGNQYEYLLRGCPELGSEQSPAPAPATPATPPASPSAAASVTPPATTPALDPAPRDPAPRATPPRPTAAVPSRPTGAPMWSVQVAALTTQTEATVMVARMRARGYDARVDGTTAPFRVRFGLFPTRAGAAAALDRYKTRDKGAGFIVEVPRG